MQNIDVSQLTLQQKASLLIGDTFWSTTAIKDHHIGAVTMADGPHGVRMQKHGTDHLGLYRSQPATCFPPAVGIGCSWSEDVAARVGAALAKESQAHGVDILLGPGVNIKRSPLGGRNFEYYSEDPLLSGVLGSAYVKALQEHGVGASVKHLAANDQETERMVISSDVDERTLREVHLSAFERVVTEAQPATVMCSYNKINGIHASENRWLLTDVLRGEWGFNGVVVSDWGAVRTRPAALNAGLDLAMPGPGQYATEALIKAVQNGSVNESAIDLAVERVLDLAAYSEPRITGTAPTEFDSAAHHELARELATECAVLLKNQDGVLPLKPGTSLLVVGEFATNPRYQGGGSSHVNATLIDIPLEELKAGAAVSDGSVHYSQGFSLQPGENDAELRAHAVEAARTVDVAVIFAGNPEEEESEGFDRTRLELAAVQVELIRAVAAAAPRTVVVLANGGVVSLEEWHDQVDGILEGFLLGQGGGRAIADLLFGVTSPSGRLAESIPFRLQDTPTYLSFPGEQGHVRYTEGVMVGYRYYETVQRPVRYPFGHGLSYSTFETTDLRAEARGHDEIAVTANITNTGKIPAKHVIQIYLSTDAGPVLRPERILAAFTKVLLQPGETREVHFLLDRRNLRYWDVILDRWVVAPGCYTVQVSDNASHVLLEQDVALDGDELPRLLSLQSDVAEWLAHPTAGPALANELNPIMAASGQQLDDDSDGTRMVLSMPMNQILSILGGAIDGDWLVSLLEQPAEATSSPA